MKHSANILTASRFFFAAGMVLVAPFSAVFWGYYLCGGVSDLLDGPIARTLHIQSEAGAKLDSAADLAFAAAIAVVVVRNIPLPAGCGSAPGASPLCGWRATAWGLPNTAPSPLCTLTPTKPPVR